MNVAVVIPARDEADRIAGTVRAATGIRDVTRVLVVDDHSADGTAELAAGAGAEVLRLKAGTGKGAALEAGLAATAGDHAAVLLLDADLGDTAREGEKLLAPILAGTADMTIATMPKPPGSGGLGLVKGLARGGIRRLGGGFEATAPLSGQRALSPAAVRAVRPIRAGYGAEVAMTVLALRAGLRLIEVPTKMEHRASGRDAAGFAHRGRQFADVARALSALSRPGRS
jgi:glycosyltransferase involved in cell wall biosynthesis